MTDSRITVPAITLEDGSIGPDMSGLGLPEGVKPEYVIDPGGETYTVIMPPGWRAPGVLSRLEFLRRLTPEERIAARQSSDPRIEDWLYLLQIAEEVRLDDPDVVAAVEYAEQIGLIAEGRAAEILAP